MTMALALGWPLAAAAVAVLVVTRRRAGTRAERVTRACHELRAPLTNAMLALEALGPEHRSPPTAGHRGRASDAPRESRPPSWPARTTTPLPDLGLELDRARRAVEDLSVAFAGTPVADERRPVALVPLVEELVAVHDLAARVRGRRVERVPGAPECVVEGDRARLAQAIGNLIQNAVEHGAGTVSVHVMTSGGRAQVRVTDEGHGLPAPVEQLLAERPRGQRGRGMRIATDALRSHGGALRRAGSGDGSVVADLPLAPRAGVESRPRPANTTRRDPPAWPAAR